MQALRNALKALTDGENASLLLSRYLKETKSEEGEKEAAQIERDSLFNTVQRTVKNKDVQSLYKAAFAARKEALSEFTKSQVFETSSRLIAGLGASNVLETGLTLNPIYGVPMIPASSIKGIAAHYCSTVWGAINEDFLSPAPDARSRPTCKAGKIYEAIFGKVQDEELNTKSEAGYVRFYDAWIFPESVSDSLRNDVMTPHHTEYYGDADGRAAPTDFDDPNPVTFLSVEGKFEVRIGCLDSDPSIREGWEKLVFKLIQEAFKFSGVGGKTSSGYGRMKRKASEEESIRNAAKEEARRLEGAGFVYKVGEEVTALCASVNKKGNGQFMLDGKSARFDPPVKSEKGAEVRARIEKIDEAKKEYILQKI